MLSFHNKLSLKIEVCNRVYKNMNADRIYTRQKEIQAGKGCFIGACAVDLTVDYLDISTCLRELESIYGLDAYFMRLCETIFESIRETTEVRNNFSRKMIDAIPIGVDLRKIADEASILINPYRLAFADNDPIEDTPYGIKTDNPYDLERKIHELLKEAQAEAV